MEPEIIVVPVGDVEPTVLAHLSSALRGVFSQGCRLEQPLPPTANALNPRRGQYSAGEILQSLRQGEAERILGVVDLDLYVPQLNFVFGLADPLSRRALFSLLRLRQEFYGLPEDQGLFLQRAVKEAVHELGHTYGLRHCHDRRCVMAFSNSLADTDFKGQAFCQRCRGRLL